MKHISAPSAFSAVDHTKRDALEAEGVSDGRPVGSEEV
jgi:hypothetical protein